MGDINFVGLARSPARKPTGGYYSSPSRTHKSLLVKRGALGTIDINKVHNAPPIISPLEKTTAKEALSASIAGEAKPQRMSRALKMSPVEASKDDKSVRLMLPSSTPECAPSHKRSLLPKSITRDAENSWREIAETPRFYSPSKSSYYSEWSDRDSIEGCGVSGIFSSTSTPPSKTAKTPCSRPTRPTSVRRRGRTPVEVTMSRLRADCASSRPSPGWGSPLIPEEDSSLRFENDQHTDKGAGDTTGQGTREEGDGYYSPRITHPDETLTVVNDAARVKPKMSQQSETSPETRIPSFIPCCKATATMGSGATDTSLGQVVEESFPPEQVIEQSSTSPYTGIAALPGGRELNISLTREPARPSLATLLEMADGTPRALIRGIMGGGHTKVGAVGAKSIDIAGQGKQSASRTMPRQQQYAPKVAKVPEEDVEDTPRRFIRGIIGQSIVAPAATRLGGSRRRTMHRSAGESDRKVSLAEDHLVDETSPRPNPSSTEKHLGVKGSVLRSPGNEDIIPNQPKGLYYSCKGGGRSMLWTLVTVVRGGVVASGTMFALVMVLCLLFSSSAPHQLAVPMH